jgi:small subunit ribosomal protein S17
MAKTLIGTVSSVAPNKTIVITIHTRKTHPIYKKQYTVSSKYMAHDENNDCEVGDKVSIVETRPLSARKRHTLKEIIQRAVLTQEDKDVITDSAKTETEDEEAK